MQTFIATIKTAYFSRQLHFAAVANKVLIVFVAELVVTLLVATMGYKRGILLRKYDLKQFYAIFRSPEKHQQSKSKKLYKLV